MNEEPPERGLVFGLPSGSLGGEESDAYDLWAYGNRNAEVLLRAGERGQGYETRPASLGAPDALNDPAWRERSVPQLCGDVGESEERLGDGVERVLRTLADDPELLAEASLPAATTHLADETIAVHPPEGGGVLGTWRFEVEHNGVRKTLEAGADEDDVPDNTNPYSTVQDPTTGVYHLFDIEYMRAFDARPGGGERLTVFGWRRYLAEVLDDPPHLDDLQEALADGRRL